MERQSIRLLDFNKFNHISTFIFDVDGVLSDGTLTISNGKTLDRTVSARDGMGIRLAIEGGYNVVIITGGNSPFVEERFRALGVKDYYGGAWNKKEVLQNYMDDKSLSKEQVIFMGDDVNDLGAMDLVGITACPANAAFDLLNRCEYISSLKGGQGCGREVIEKVMRIQNKWIN